MNAENFYHICRSAAAIARVPRVTVFGAAAVVPWIGEFCPEAPFWPSLELDIDPGGAALADLVDGSIGEGSLFEETFGVRAHGISLEAFVAPPDWRGRARIFEEPESGISIEAPHPFDLAVAKLVRGEDRDWEFASFCCRHFGLSPEKISDGLKAVAASRREYAEAARLADSLLARKLPNQDSPRKT